MADTQHNFSSQTDVVKNNDPALDVAREHHHEHLHHSARAEKGREDEVVYTTGTTAERSNVPDADPLDNALHNRGHPERGHPERISKKDDIGIDYDTAEKGYDVSDENGSHGSQTRAHRLKRFYRHWRIWIHLLILIVMTGSAIPNMSDEHQLS